MNNFPIADWAVDAYMGFRDKQANIVFFEDINEVPVSTTNIVVAYIEDTNKYFEKLGLPPKQALNIPFELDNHFYTKRGVARTTMGWFKENCQEKAFPIFIKPDGKAKEFVAGVVTKKEYMDMFFKDVKDDAKILISDVVDIVSEWRVYVINGQIKGVKWYLGDHLTFPDKNFIIDAVYEYKSAPSAYGIDFGVLKNGETVLIEANDGWSLGNYGLEPSTYSTLLATRWREIMKDVPKDTKKYYYGAAHEHVPNPRR